MLRVLKVSVKNVATDRDVADNADKLAEKVDNVAEKVDNVDNAADNNVLIRKGNLSANLI